MFNFGAQNVPRQHVHVPDPGGLSGGHHDERIRQILQFSSAVAGKCCRTARFFGQLSYLFVNSEALIENGHPSSFSGFLRAN